ncbi:threonine synthase [Candidatus Micrarchaeota archaeon]|nr:threonine synthase [Candidatus Micrarchaeota archaeon]
MKTWLECCRCKKRYATRREDTSCTACGHLLEVQRDVESVGVSRDEFTARQSKSGVWRFKEVVHPDLKEGQIVTFFEGNTPLYESGPVSDFAGAKILLKHEGRNPTGSFKDRGMTVGVSEAVRRKAKAVICASTGNTSASLAAYAARAGLPCVVLLPEGKISYGKLAQAISHGARVVQVQGNFDKALALVRELAKSEGYYVLNSVNPWRLEGQKTIIWEALMQNGWKVPDFIVAPGGNLGNTSAFGKALLEAKRMGWIDRLPRLVVVQAERSAPLHATWKQKSDELLRVADPETVATAIRIGEPVNWAKALKYIERTNGLVESVTDQELLDAKAHIDASGIGCEPASATSVAGVRKLVRAGVIKPHDSVMCVLTGHGLKDAETTMAYHQGTLEGIKPTHANKPVVVRATLTDLKRALS